MSTVHALVPNRPGILDDAAMLLHRRGLRLTSIDVSRSDRPAWARLTMQVHEDDVHDVILQIERHLMGERPPATPAPDPSGEASGSFRWQADGARDDEAA